MARMVSKGRQTLEAIFTKEEIDYCESKARRAEHYAARFAAKEAILKALGTGGWRDGLAFSDFEIINDDLGKPQVILYGRAKDYIDQQKIKQISISLSHIKEFAIAVAILEK